MALQSYEATQIRTTLPDVKHHDIEFEIGALASRHGISLDRARTIVAKCGSDLGCIDDEVRRWRMAQ
jgi:hypothetical protein